MIDTAYDWRTLCEPGELARRIIRLLSSVSGGVDALISASVVVSTTMPRDRRASITAAD